VEEDLKWPGKVREVREEAYKTRRELEEEQRGLVAQVGVLEGSVREGGAEREEALANLRREFVEELTVIREEEGRRENELMGEISTLELKFRELASENGRIKNRGKQLQETINHLTEESQTKERELREERWRSGDDRRAGEGKRREIETENHQLSLEISSLSAQLEEGRGKWRRAEEEFGEKLRELEKELEREGRRREEDLRREKERSRSQIDMEREKMEEEVGRVKVEGERDSAHWKVEVERREGELQRFQQLLKEREEGIRREFEAREKVVIQEEALKVREVEGKLGETKLRYEEMVDVLKEREEMWDVERNELEGRISRIQTQTPTKSNQHIIEGMIPSPLFSEDMGPLSPPPPFSMSPSHNPTQNQSLLNQSTSISDLKLGQMEEENRRLKGVVKEMRSEMEGMMEAYQQALKSDSTPELKKVEEERDLLLKENNELRGEVRRLEMLVGKDPFRQNTFSSHATTSPQVMGGVEELVKKAYHDGSKESERRMRKLEKEVKRMRREKKSIAHAENVREMESLSEGIRNKNSSRKDWRREIGGRSEDEEEEEEEEEDESQLEVVGKRKISGRASERETKSQRAFLSRNKTSERRKKALERIKKDEVRRDQFVIR